MFLFKETVILFHITNTPLTQLFFQSYFKHAKRIEGKVGQYCINKMFQALWNLFRNCTW